MANILHQTEEEATELLVDISLTLPDKVKMHQTPFWSYVKQIQKTFGLVWREDKKMFLRVKEL